MDKEYLNNLIKLEIKQENIYHSEIFNSCRSDEDKKIESLRYEHALKSIFDKYEDEKKNLREINNNVEKVLE